MTIRKTTVVKAKTIANGCASPAGVSNSLHARILVPTVASHCHPNVVIVASPSRAPRLLQCQSNRAVDVMRPDQIMDTDTDCVMALAAIEETTASHGDAHCGESVSTAFSSPSKRMPASTLGNSTMVSPTGASAVVQISPNAVKRKRSHSLVTASTSTGESSVSAPTISSASSSILPPTVGETPTLTTDLRVGIDAPATSPHSRVVAKRGMKARDGRITPSKRCGGKEKKKKQKVDVIERALKRFRSELKQQHEDESLNAQFFFEFASVAHRDDADARTSVTTPRPLGGVGVGADNTTNANANAFLPHTNSWHGSGELTACQPISVHVGVAAAQGARAYMEDRFSVVARLFEHHAQRHELQSHASLLALYDGHNGGGAADYASRRFRELLGDSELLLNLCRRPAFVAMSDDDVARVEALLKDMFEVVDDEIVENTMAENKRDGSTVLLGLLLCGKLFIANLGDTRGVLGTAVLTTDDVDANANTNGTGLEEVVRVSVDHKPDLPAETERVEEAGGKVIFSGCWRVAHDEIPLRLAVSRSLGDHPLKANLPFSCSAPLVSVVPDIQVLDVNATNGDLLVLATDGLWDRLSDDDAVRVARTKIAEFHAQQRQGQVANGPAKNTMQAAAIALVETALVKRSMDNITAMVIGFSAGHRLDDVETEEPCPRVAEIADADF